MFSLEVFAAILLVLSWPNRTRCQWNSSTWSDHLGIDCSLDHWLHIPKTGSTFCLAIQHVCCPVEFENLTAGITTAELSSHGKKPFHYQSSYCYRFIREGYPDLECHMTGRPEHIPLIKNGIVWSEQVLAIIREPKSRVISALLDAKHHEGMIPSVWNQLEKQMKEAVDKNETRAYLNLLKAANVYANHPDISGK